MARNKIETSKQFFASLESVYRDAGLGLSARDSGSRWIAESTPGANERLVHLRCRACHLFRPSLGALHLDSDDRGSFIVAIGLNAEYFSPESGVEEVELDSGIFQVAVLSSNLRATAGPRLVYENVAWGAKGQPNYSGHNLEQIAPLYPSIVPYRVPATLGSQEVEAILWDMVLSHCVAEGAWIDEVQATSLRCLSASPIPDMPYADLSWAALSHDRRSLFLALYRCLEAAYAHGKIVELSGRLRYSAGWSTLAGIVEGVLGWRPQELQSLTDLLRRAHRDDVERLYELLRGSDKPKDDVVAGAAERIYRVRNGIVHYRAGGDRVSPDQYEWNEVCTLLAKVVLDVLSDVHEVVAGS